MINISRSMVETGTGEDGQFLSNSCHSPHLTDLYNEFSGKVGLQGCATEAQSGRTGTPSSWRHSFYKPVLSTQVVLPTRSVFAECNCLLYCSSHYLRVAAFDFQHLNSLCFGRASGNVTYDRGIGKSQQSR